MQKIVLLVFAGLLALVKATDVEQCENVVEAVSGNQIRISGCEGPPCKLKQGTQVFIEQRFTPTRDIQSLTNSVQAVLFNVPLPFVGVDGTDACQQIYNADGSKTNCPLRKGKEYIYKNSFPVLPFYPRVSLNVHYALLEGNEKVTCFEMPSKITK